MQGKEELQVTIPARDLFSEEIRIFISNSKIVSFKTSCLADGAPVQGTFFQRAGRRCAEIRLYSGSENVDIGR